MSTGVQYLREALHNRNLVPIVGAGFAAATASLPSWPGLLQRGVEYVKAAAPGRAVPARQVKALETLAKTGDLLEAFGYLQKILSDDSRAHYESFAYQGLLNEVFHDVKISSTDLALSIRALRARVIFTTNYDLLLEDLGTTTGRDSVTWLNPSSIRNVLRNGSGIVHLHGRYDIPNSVILSRDDYQRLVSDDDSMAIAQAAFHSGVLLFVGASVDGASDPHFGRILREFARISDRTRDEQSPHFALFAGRPSGTEIAQLRSLGIEAVSYGASHSELPGFLRSLAESERVVIASRAVRTLAQSTVAERTKVNALQHVAEFMRREIFDTREVRITFAEKIPHGSNSILESRYVIPVDSTHNVFNYPLSIAAWSLIEGRIIAWPDASDKLCDFDLIDQLGKTEAVHTAVMSAELNAAPEIARYVNLERVREGFRSRQLILGDFFQDWTRGQARPRYNQFLCLPVPMIESFGNRETPKEHGVFNIDALGGAPLLDGRSEELLKLAASFATIICERFRGDPEL